MSGSGSSEALANLVEYSDARHVQREAFAVEAEARRLERELLAEELSPPLAGLLEQAMAMVATTQRLLLEHGQNWSEGSFVNEIQTEMVSIAGQIRSQIAQTVAAQAPAGEPGDEEAPPSPPKGQGKQPK